MSQSGLTKLVPKLRYNLQDRRRLRNPEGPKGRHNKIRKIVTALFKHERIETNYNKGDESRGYAERLISDAIRYGDCHKATMDMANYWITEKQLVHKLFKVLAPRYQNCPLSYTKMWRAPNVYPGYGFQKCVIELRDNIYPPLGPDKTNHKNLIHNVLLREAKKEFKKEKALKEEKLSATASAESNVGVSPEKASTDTEVLGSEMKTSEVSADSNSKEASADAEVLSSEMKTSEVSADAEVLSSEMKTSEVSADASASETSADAEVLCSEIKTSKVSVDASPKETSVDAEVPNSEMKRSEVEVKVGENVTSESVKMSETSKELSKKDVVKEKELNLDSLKVSETEDKESPTKEKDK